ncbi:MAG: anaerobic glycerol-3-phosphate dehydrogenase subunit C [Vulcanimicrobiota bacterium]
MADIPGKTVDQCLKCTICHTHCPLVAIYPSFPGPKSIGPEIERFRIAGESIPPELESLLSYCLNCKRCDLACPHDVMPSSYTMHYKLTSARSAVTALRDWVLAHNVWWGTVGCMAPGPFNTALRMPVSRFFMGILGIAPRDFPEYKKPYSIRRTKQKGTVVYFPGCFARFNAPEIMEAAEALLSCCGYNVESAPLGCCSIPMLTNSLRSESIKTAERNAHVLVEAIEGGAKIVTTCSSCGLALKQEYRELLEEEKAEKLASGVFDIFELLAEEGHEPYRQASDPIEKAYYHVSCHLKAQGIGAPAASYLRKHAVKDLIIDDRFCCGISGTFGFKKEKYSLSMEIGSPLFERIKESGASAVITDCSTCTLQIGDGTGLPVIHPVVALRNAIKVQ